MLVRVADENGGSDDPWLIRLVADTLFGEDGFLGGCYEAKVKRVIYRNLATSGVWEGSWPEMRGAGGTGGLTIRRLLDHCLICQAASRDAILAR